MASIELPIQPLDAPVKHRRAAAWLQATPFTFKNYAAIFDGCSSMTDVCVTFKTYWSTIKFCAIVWAVTLVLGFTIAYFLSFHIRSSGMQTVLFLVCTIPFWTSNVIRMISWIPLLGRNGLVNQAL